MEALGRVKAALRVHRDAAVSVAHDSHVSDRFFHHVQGGLDDVLARFGGVKFHTVREEAQT
jgi:hypothetical protein